ncbi:MAG: FtsX-like permease family protein, partial [Chloroflexi bacterium]|nr:FtsX-like permease family protein [Chloroflexota bacterium]
MNTIILALRNIRGNNFRSIVIFSCVAAVTLFSLSTTFIIRGAQGSLNAGIERLGADIIVAPAGSEQKVESVLLMSKPSKIWMPGDIVDQLADVRGVAAVSPQIFLSSLYDASCCEVSELFLVVFDPETDFTVTPWLQKKLGRDLVLGEVIGGSYVFTPPGDNYITLYGYDLMLAGNLAATGTGLDQTVFVPLETAQAMAAASATQAVTPLEIPPDSISAALVKVPPGVDRHLVAQRISTEVPGVVAIESPQLFGTFRQQMTGLLWGFLVVMAIIWVLSAVLLGLVFSMAANERRREVAVLRALGATRKFIFQSSLAEAVLLAFVAAVVGILLAAFLVFLFQRLISASIGMPFLFPSFVSLLILVVVGTAIAIAIVSLAGLV